MVALHSRGARSRYLHSALRSMSKDVMKKARVKARGRGLGMTMAAFLSSLGAKTSARLWLTTLCRTFFLAIIYLLMLFLQAIDSPVV